jgi:hypothetical protein
MASVNLTEAEFYGRTMTPALLAERTRPECQGCGSSLHGRSEGLQRWGSKLVRVFACPCGRRRRLEVAAR